MRKILVTGGTGFIGSSLTRRLREKNYDVRILGRSAERAAAAQNLGAEVVLSDLRNPDAVAQAVSGCDTVFHLAAAYRREGMPLQEFHEVNATGTENVVRACVRHDVTRLIHVSTVGVYGHISTPPADEQHSLEPGDHYQRTKLEGENIAREAGQTALRGRVVIARPGGVYGPGDLRFLKLYRWIAKGHFVYPGPCQVQYQPTFIDDLLDGLELLATHPAAPGGAFNLGGREYVTIEQFVKVIARVLGVREPRWHVPLWPLRLTAPIVEIICRSLGVEPPIFRRRVAFFHTHRAYSIEKARQVLDYQPRVGLEEGIQRTANWYQLHGYLALNHV